MENRSEEYEINGGQNEEPVEGVIANGKGWGYSSETKAK